MKLKPYLSKPICLKNSKLNFSLWNFFFFSERALILQTSNSSKPRNPNEPNVDLMELTKILVQKQTELNNFCNIGK